MLLFRDHASTTTESALRRTLALSYVSRLFVSAPLFVAPTIFAFWSSFQLSPPEIGALETAYALLVAVLEIPSGIVADRIGRRWTLVIAGAFWVTGNALYLTGDSFWDFVVCEGCVALGVSMISGTDQALVFETLKRLGRPDDFTRIWGRCRMIDLVTGAAYAVVGGHLAAMSNRLPFVAALIFLACYLAIAIMMRDPRGSIGASEADRPTFANMYRALVSARSTLWLVLLAAAVASLAPIVNVFGQARLRETGFAIEALGYVAAAGALVSGFVAASSYRLERRSTETPLLLLVAAMVGIAFCGLALGPTAALPLFILLFRATDVFANTILATYLNRETPTLIRASMLSSVALLGRIASAGSTSLFAIVLVRHSVATGFLVVAPLATAAIVALLAIRHHRRQLSPQSAYNTAAGDSLAPARRSDSK